MRQNRWEGGARLAASLILILPLISLAACSSGESGSQMAVVAPDRLELKSSTAKVSRSVGELRSGDRVTVLERVEDGGTNWVRLRAPGGQAGWAEARYLVDQQVVERSRRLAEESQQVQTQAVGRSKALLKLRLTPDRSTEENVATMLPSGTVLEIVDRERRLRPAPADAKGATQPVASVKEEEEPAGAKYDEWYKVRLKEHALLPAGWIYAGSVELEVPPEISYYVSSGRRIIGWQKLGTARDEEGRAGDHYLTLERWTSSSDDKLDFDRLQVLAYDPAARDYYVPFREDVQGRLPVTLSMEGSRGRFQVKALDKEGNLQTLDYSVEMVEQGRVRVTRLTPKEKAAGKRKR
jgi:uncharacterized protein YgiM (DUF1202 family)